MWKVSSQFSTENSTLSAHATKNKTSRYCKGLRSFNLHCGNLIYRDVFRPALWGPCSVKKPCGDQLYRELLESFCTCTVGKYSVGTWYSETSWAHLDVKYSDVLSLVQTAAWGPDTQRSETSDILNMCVPALWGPCYVKKHSRDLMQCEDLILYI